MASDARTRLEYGGAAVDRISSLPTSLVDIILELLSTHDAARTSILSKTWRNVWGMHPRLHLDDDFFSQLVSRKFSELDKQTQRIEVCRTITNIFSAHSGPVLDFLLCIPENLPIHQSPDMAIWIKNISDSGVRKLELLNKSVFNACAVPSHFFSCSQLTHLNLMNFELNPPLGFGGFCNLIRVELMCVTINADMSLGTQLKELDMEMCDGIEHFQFNCENNLTKLRIIDCEFIWQWFECFQKLQVLTLELNELPSTGTQVMTLDRLVHNMPRLNTLHLDGLVLKILKPGAATFMRFTRTMENLKYLDLQAIELYELVQSQHVLSLIRSSPNLQRLDIELAHGIQSSDGVDLLDLAVLSDHMILGRLETIMISDLIGSLAEFQLIKLLLVSSPSLKRIQLWRDPMVNDPTYELTYSQEVSQIPRASKSAKIQWM